MAHVMQLSRAAVKRLGGASELDDVTRSGWLTIVDATKLCALSDRHLRRIVRNGDPLEDGRHVRSRDLDVLRVWHEDIPVRPNPDNFDLSAPGDV